MANANIHPITPDTIRNQTLSHATANTLRDGTGTITSLFTAGLRGSVVNRVLATHAGAIGAASTALVARLWKTNGGTSRLVDEVAIPAATPTAAVVGTAVTFAKTNIVLVSGDSLGVTLSVSEAVHFAAEGGDF